MKDYTQLLNRLIAQLDTLISFMGLSHEEVFQLLRRERTPWLGESADSLPEAYTTYRMQVIHSAFLLGYSYFESFLTDLLSAILRSRPTMLRGSRQLSYSQIIAADSKDAILDQIVKRESFDLLYKNMADIVAELRRRYQFTVTPQQETELRKASLIRNCIMHNSCRADARLSEYNQFQEGEDFELSSREVHDFGLTLRALARAMFSEAIRNHGIGVEPLTEGDLT